MSGPAPTPRYALGVDIGTTFTAAAVWREGRAEVAFLGDRTRVMPSVVLARADGTFLVGEAAVRHGRAEPDRVAREFARRIGDPVPIWLRDVPHPAEELTARLLRAVVDSVTEAEAGPPATICLTHPATWGPHTQDRFHEVVRLAEVDLPVTFTAEPVAAATCYAHRRRVEPGAMVTVFDLGGTTCGAAVLRRTVTGFELLGTPEVAQVGGVDLDAAVFDHVRRALGGRLEEPSEEDPRVMAAVARLREECVQAREALSFDTEAAIPVLLPGITREVRLTRAELESTIRPAVATSVAALRRALQSARVEPAQLHSVLLVGGASRTPAVARLVGAELGRPVTVDAHPDHTIALGAAHQAAGSASAWPSFEAAATREMRIPPPPGDHPPARADAEPRHGSVGQPTRPPGPPGAPPPPAWHGRYPEWGEQDQGRQYQEPVGSAAGSPEGGAVRSPGGGFRRFLRRGRWRTRPPREGRTGAAGREPAGVAPGPQTREAYPSLDAPPEVVVGQAFALRVGISPVAVTGVAGDRFGLPGSDFRLGVQVIAEGFRLAGGDSWRRQLPVTDADPYPWAVFRLVADDPGRPVAARLIQASYTVGGSVVGFGARSIAVVRTAALLGAQPPPAQQPVPRVTVAEGDPAADLTAVITLTDVEGKLLWAFESPHVDPPDPEPCRLGADARRFARTLIDQVQRKEGDPDLYPFLLGSARAVADKVPAGFFDTLARVARAVAPRRPTVLIQSAEPYVPWELAALPAPLDPAVPPFLACQATVGRWVLAPHRPKLPPPAHAEATTMTVVSGVYGEVDPRWERLPCAEEEARLLAAMRTASSVDAKLAPVIALLSAGQVADILHFAVHGSADPAGLEDGLILTDGKTLSSRTIKGTDLPSEPFVFLNACQVGTGDAVLGDYGGMAAAFLYAGASAVVAPLWSVKDCVAKELVLEFYRRVFAGAVPAEAIRELRCGVGGPGSTVASALAYQFFGHPTMLLGDRP